MILSPGDIAIDYSFARPAPAAIVAAGVRLVVRYISPNRANKKNLTVAERDALLAAGLSILLVWENSTTDPLQGAHLGTIHGNQAGAFARDLGYPLDFPIIIAVDFDAQLAQTETILDYCQAFKATCGYSVGVYGKAAIVSVADLRGVSILGWQTVAWSRRVVSPQAHCLQHATPVHPSVPLLGAVDDNTVLRSFKAWSTFPDPLPIPIPGDSDMPKFFDNAETRTMPYGQAPPQTAVFISDVTKRNIGGEEYKAWGSPARVSLTNAALDAIPDAGSVVIPPIVVPPLTGHLIADIDTGTWHITGSVG